MGNSQSNDISEEYTHFIEEQKKIIESQQNQIDRLTKLNQRSEVKEVVKKEKRPLTNAEKIQVILKLFELPNNYDEGSLKKSYLKFNLPLPHPSPLMLNPFFLSKLL